MFLERNHNILNKRLKQTKDVRLKLELFEDYVAQRKLNNKIVQPILVKMTDQEIEINIEKKNKDR